MLVDFADLMSRAMSTAHLVLDPCCFCGDVLFARLKRRNGRSQFQLRDNAYRVVEALGEFCVNATRSNPEHAAPPEFRKVGWTPNVKVSAAQAEVVALEQVERFLG